MKSVAHLLCIALIQAFKINKSGYKESQSLRNTSNRIREQNKRFSRYLQFVQLSKAFSFNHCREIKWKETKPESNFHMKTERGEVRWFNIFTNHRHSFENQFFSNSCILQKSFYVWRNPSFDMSQQIVERSY